MAGQVRVRSAAVITGRLPPVLKDLLFRAKDLFMAAMVSILPLPGGSWLQSGAIMRLKRAALLRLPGGALPADSHQQPARAHPARDPTAHPCGGRVPDGQSALNLAAGRLRHIADTAWSIKRYLNIELLKDI